MQIKVSKKYGVNPTIPICFWCGKAKDEVALVGRLAGDEEAPKNTIVDYEPCDECKAIFAQGIRVIEVSFDSNKYKSPPLDKKTGAIPTGRLLVLKEDFSERAFLKEVADEIISKKVALMIEEEFQMLLAHLDKNTGGENNGENTNN